MRLLIMGLFCSLSPCSAWAQSYFLNGDASYLGNNCYQVTANNDWQNGTVWYSDQLDLTEDFSIEFDMYFGTSDANGADGMAFVMQTVGSNAIGASGGGMGFQGFNPSFGIEFDTFFNGDASDPSYDHVAFLRNGNIFHNSADNLAGPVAATSGQTNIEDGQAHQIKITWDVATQTVALYVDCQLRLTDQINLINSIFQGSSMVYWGFTGATGGFFNQQKVCLDIIVNNAPNSYSVCAGQPVELAANGSLAGTVLWSPADELDDPLSFQPIATPTQSTTYCYTYTDFCGESTLSCIEVEVVDLPTISTNQQMQFCAGETYLLEASVTGTEWIQWSAQQGNLIGSANGTAVQVSGEGEYSIDALTTLDGCAASATVAVAVIPLPEYNPSVIGICPNELAALEIPEPFEIIAWWNGWSESALTVEDSGSYSAVITDGLCSNEVVYVVQEWAVPNLELGPDIVFCLQDEPLVLDANIEVMWDDGTLSNTLEVMESGIYQAVWSDENCLVADEVAVQITLQPQVLINGPQGFCEGEEAVLQSSHDGIWSTGQEGSSLTVQEEGQYSIMVQDGPCQSTQSAQVQMWEVPELELGPDLTVCANEVVALSAGEESSVFQYLWNTGEESPSIEIDWSGWITCIKSNVCGQAIDSVLVEWMDCETQLFIPNSFSPNGDGVNEVWRVVGMNASDLRIQIFDRWGLLVFESTGTEQPWLGDHQGGTTYVPSDVYHYVIRFVDIRGEHKKKMGIVSVIR
jgi:gliding motility-associated-like protein